MDPGSGDSYADRNCGASRVECNNCSTGPSVLGQEVTHFLSDWKCRGWAWCISGVNPGRHQPLLNGNLSTESARPVWFAPIHRGKPGETVR